MTQLVLLHTNDLHGHIDALARIATLVERVRAEGPVVYLDAGDIEESTVPISNATKGAALHRVLSAAGCEAAVVGNASWLSYGPDVLPAHAAEACYPLLLANLRAPDGSLFEGTSESVLIEAGGVRLGVVGVSSAVDEHDPAGLGMSPLPVVPLVLEQAAALRGRGADRIVVLSHLGLDQPRETIDDRRLAAEVQGSVDLIVGAHSHDLLPEGEWIGSVLVVQAGEKGGHLGRVDFDSSGLRASVQAVTDEVPCHPAVLAAAASIEPEIEALRAEVIGELPDALDREAATRWLADLIRERMDAEIALVTPGAAFTGPLPAGRLSRGALWDACDSRANPGVAKLSGEQLEAVLARGADPAFAATTARSLRGRPRGLLQVSGDGGPIDPGREYRVAGTDWELEQYGGLVEADWGLRPTYDFPTILREVVEEHLRGTA